MRKYKTRPNCKECHTVCKNLRNTYCSNKCQRESEYRQYIARWLRCEESGNCGEEGISAHIRRYFFAKWHSKCSKCSWGEVNPKTGTVPLTLNHIDGNYRNSFNANLELLCPNCHSLTPNYGVLNIGHGRKQRLKTLQNKVLLGA